MLLIYSYPKTLHGSFRILELSKRKNVYSTKSSTYSFYSNEMTEINLTKIYTIFQNQKIITTYMLSLGPAGLEGIMDDVGSAEGICCCLRASLFALNSFIIESPPAVLTVEERGRRKGESLIPSMHTLLTDVEALDMLLSKEGEPTFINGDPCRKKNITKFYYLTS